MSGSDTSESDKASTAGDPRDAGFLDSFKPARLVARDAEDLAVVSALMQDAVVLAKDVAWLPTSKRFALVANRYRWEAPDAEERVRVGIHFDGVRRARVRGVDAQNGDRPIVILALAFEPAETAPTGVLRFRCAPDPETGKDVEIALDVEAIDVSVRDMTRPWAAKGRPAHDVAPDVDPIDNS